MATEISNGKKTVKLYSSVNRGKAMFQLSFYEGGKRVQRNFSDKAEAKRVARSIVGELARDGEAVDNLSTSDLESYVAARKVLAPNYPLHLAVAEHAQAVSKLGKATLQDAVQFYLRHNRADVGRVSLATLCEQFVASRAQSGFTTRYVKSCRRDTQLLVKAFPGESISDLNTESLDAWLGKIRGGTVTKNYYLKTFTTLGNWAEKRGHLIKGSNPFLGTIRYKEPKEPVSIFTPEQLRKVLEAAPRPIVPFLAMGAFAGLRAAELQKLDWNEVDLERGFVTVAASKAKTRRRRLVPISDNLKQWLLPLKQASGPICLHPSAQTMAKQRAKGIQWAKNGLRHSFISYLLAILHDTARVALEAGNSPDIIFGHYRELVTPEAAQAWFDIRPTK